MLEVLQDLFAFMKARKKVWLVPLILILVFMGIIMIFSVASGLAPFIYPFF